MGVAMLVLPAAGGGASASEAAGPLAWKGIVEGPYGPPWTHAERMRVLRWMPAHGFDTYVHAPKDDLYQRTNWRDPYPQAEQRDYTREIRFARRHGVEWVPNLSPALPLIPTPALPSQPPSRDLCFSCPADLEVVAGKLQPFLDAGARTVMVSFDDVSKVMTHSEDLVAYGAGDAAFGEANGDFLTRLRERLREDAPGARLLTVGADYSGTADTAYLQALRSALAPGIDVMWTGTGVPSEHWTPADAAAYGQRIGRRPVVWDNWTNNDTAGNATPLGTARIFLGPYKREAATAGAVRGFFFNPANEADLNLLPLATAGDWMRDPRGYRPRRSWRRAIRELAPGDGAVAVRRRASLRAWADASWDNKLDRERPAPAAARLIAAFLDRYDAGGDWPRARAALARELRLVEKAPARLPNLPNAAIAEQAAGFLENGETSARAGHLAARLLAAERPLLRVRGAPGGGARGRAAPPDPEAASSLRSQVSAATTAARADSEWTYGWRTSVAFEIPPYAVPGNVADDFADAALSRDAAWLPGAGDAAASVSVDLDGEPVSLDSSGRFRLPPGSCGGRLVATDGAGGETVRRVRCR
jgi:hyaluronoglucosaminidase